jgi:tetratricopeptide (TPR) repeat protein
MTLCLCASAARAQDNGAEAQARFGEGVKAYQRGDFEHARLLFIQSLALVPRGSVLRNLGLAEMELGRLVDALHHLRAALELPDLDPKRRSVTESDIREAYAATGHVLVETEDGATLTVDGETVEGKAPFKAPIDVMPGRHALQASFAAKSAHTEVEAQAGRVVTAKLPLEPPAPALAPQPSAASMPLTTPALKAPPIAESPSSPKRPFWSVRRELGVGLVAAGLVSTAAGVYFFTQAMDAENRANAARGGLAPWSCSGPAQPPACAVANDAWSAQSTDATLNYVFLGVGVASVVAGAALFLWPDSSASVAVAPSVTPHGGGLHFRAEF